MTMCPAVQQRKLEKQKLLEFLKENPALPIEESMAKYSCDTGFKVSKLKEYIRELKDAKLIEVEIDG